MIGRIVPLLSTFLMHRDQFRVRFPVGGFELEMWDRPGTFATEEQLTKLVDDMRRVALAGQEGKPLPEYGPLLGDRADLSKRIITIAYDRKTGEPAGFNALAYLDVLIGVRRIDVVHLGLTFIAPDFQRRGLPSLLYGVTTFLLFFKTGLRRFWISNVTQVPAVFGLTVMNYDAVYPSHLPTRQSFLHLVLARGIMHKHRSAFGVGAEAGFDEARQVITNAYTGGSDTLKKAFADAPKHRDERVNALCEAWLDYDRGDDVLQLGQCSIRAILTYARSTLPRGSLPTLTFQALSLLVLGLLVPLVRWLIPNDATERSELM